MKSLLLLFSVGVPLSLSAADDAPPSTQSKLISRVNEPSFQPPNGSFSATLGGAPNGGTIQFHPRPAVSDSSILITEPAVGAPPPVDFAFDAVLITLPFDPPNILDPILEIPSGSGHWISSGSGSLDSGRITFGTGTRKPKTQAGGISSLDPKPESVTKVTPLRNGSVEVLGSGNPGFRYAVEASPDLKTWSQVGFAANESGALRFTHSETSPGSRFYRLRVQN